jgi:predicted nucleic acid-binding protein
LSHFIDTNIAVYSFGHSPKGEIALRLLEDATISVQVLNEFVNVATRKLKYTNEDLEVAISDIRAAASRIVSIDEDTHDVARRIFMRYKLAFYDCLLLFSEDMQDGMVIEDLLTIRNPFA